ncbi:hypothetical protein MKX01_016852 [Papaver californicum]|nr:hypothetical protein MKX01_016852 [Papaver californicum]
MNYGSSTKSIEVDRDISQPDETGLIHDSHRALNSPDNKIENIHENPNEKVTPFLKRREYVLTKGNSAWRTEKSKQRRLVKDATTVQEKKRRLPTYCKKEDWEDPTVEIYRPFVFLETRKALVKEAYDKDPSAQKCLGTDVVTMAMLQEEKDNVRKEKQKNEALKTQLDAERKRRRC